MRKESAIFINTLISEGIKQMDEMVLVAKAKNDNKTLALACTILEMFNMAKEDMSEINSTVGAVGVDIGEIVWPKNQ